jgi:acetate kinase
MNVLVLNAGSSSIKYELFSGPEQEVVCSGAIERIGERAATHRHIWRGSVRLDGEVSITDHRSGFVRLADALAADGVDQASLTAVGHRVVHGGEEFMAPALIDDSVVEAIHRQAPLAPLHNPANLLGIEAARAKYPDRPHVAVFDTAFHTSLPPRAYRYALPAALYDRHRVRRYGFHGTSHRFVMHQTARFLGRPVDTLNMIVLHLGNGASASAIAGGRCVDTSMGLTPLEGLVMGTRCGDIDPAIVFYLARETGATLDELETMLNRASGLKGLCGDNDMRVVLQRVADCDADAALAVDVYCYHIRKYIGAYFAALGRVDALVFTAGVGENQPQIRADACRGLELLGIAVDDERNAAARGGIAGIHAPSSRVAVLVVPTDEEREIARQTLACVQGSG